MNIYVSNLSFDSNEEDLKELFEAYGTVSSAKIIMDRMTGRSRGFGFVEMDDDAQGQKAIDELNQCTFDGKTINVNVAKPREDRGNRGFSGRGNRGDYNSDRRGGRDDYNSDRRGFRR